MPTIIESGREPVISAEYCYAGPNNERMSETVGFPAPEDTIAGLLERAGVNGTDERVFFVEDYKSGVHGLADALDEIEGGVHPGELNELAGQLGEMDAQGRRLFASALEMHRHGRDMDGLMNFADRINAALETLPDRENRKIQDYEVIHTIRIDGVDVIVAENPASDAEPFMLCEGSVGGNPFGLVEYRVIDAGSDYLKIMQGFADKIAAHVSALRLDKAYDPPLDYPLTSEDCIPGGLAADLKGKIIAIKMDALAPEYRFSACQLMRAEGGFGCAPNARGSAVYCTEIYTGKQIRREKHDVLGVVRPDRIPDWAREKLAALEEKLPEKESVLAKIREARTQPAPERKPKEHDKSEESEH